MIQGEWLNNLQKEFSKPYYKELYNTVNEAYANDTVYPPADKIFNALELTPLENVKCVIIGQDPYHGKGQANGLAFSVNDDCEIPPSLQNIYKEIRNEYKIPDLNTSIYPKNGNLENWAKQGVLLLNSSLTVLEGRPNSHSNIGWQYFTDAIIRIVNEKTRPVVFMLWGNNAKSITDRITFNSYHLVLTTSHPSPYSVNRGFNDCGHFKKCNNFLIKNKIQPINWIYDWY